MLPSRRPAKTSHRRRPQLSLETLERREMMAVDFRAIDGFANNLAPEFDYFGSTNAELLRYIPAVYGDGLNTLAGANRASPRVISNAVNAQSQSIVSSNRLTSFVFQWGQFIDHDLDLSDTASPPESAPIPVPAGDPHFDPNSTGTKTIPFNRSEFIDGITTPREQFNSVTAYLDGSQVYGSTQERADALRTFVGGKMKMSDNGLMMYNTTGLPNGTPSPNDDPTHFYFAGDVRANEQVGLTALHTLFVREHNRLADEYARANPQWSDQEIYLHARRIVGAEIQAITYREFLPAVLGPNALPSYTGYDPISNAGISTEFSTAAFRVGHTMLPTELLRLDANGQTIAEGNLALRDAFFDPTLLRDAGGIDPILRGLATQLQQEIDVGVVDDVRNFLFGPPGAGGFDLASLNIQRGRDHGLPSYNQIRVAIGLPAVTSFAQITSNVQVQNKLATAYASVDDIDLWVGGLAEDHLPSSNLGATFSRIWVDQFSRLRDGDRYYYERDLTPSEIALFNGMTLAQVIRSNTNIGNIQENVFQKAFSAEFRHADNTSDTIALPEGSNVFLRTVQGQLQLVDFASRQVYLRADVTDIRSVHFDGRNGAQDHVKVFLVESVYNPPVFYQGGVGERDQFFVDGTAGRDIFRLNGNFGSLNSGTLSLPGVEDIRVNGFGGSDVFATTGKQSRQIVFDGGTGDDIYAPAATGVSYFITDESGRDQMDLRQSAVGVIADLGIAQGQSQRLSAQAILRLYSQLEVLIGTQFNDSLLGNNVANPIYGLAGDDVLFGRGGNDLLVGGQGEDILLGEDGNDVLYGVFGNDILHGGRGDDILYGQEGQDVLIGGYGSDALIGHTEEDLYISGDTVYSTNVDALLQILFAWTRPGIPNLVRIDDLQSGVGPNRSVKLTENETLLDDFAADLLISNASDKDWLLFNRLDTTRFRV